MICSRIIHWLTVLHQWLAALSSHYQPEQSELLIIDVNPLIKYNTLKNHVILTLGNSDIEFNNKCGWRWISDSHQCPILCQNPQGLSSWHIPSFPLTGHDLSLVFPWLAMNYLWFSPDWPWIIIGFPLTGYELSLVFPDRPWFIPEFPLTGHAMTYPWFSPILPWSWWCSLGFPLTDHA